MSKMTALIATRRHAWRRAPLVVWLTLVWLLLWGTLDVATVLGGVIVASVVVLLFPMPPITRRGRLRPLRVLQLLWWLLADLFTSAFQVAWESISYGPRTKAGIVAVPVPTDTDHVVATAANLISLGPGKFVLQIDREQRVFYVYALGMQGQEDASKIRREVLEMQSWVVRAIGSDEDVRALDHLGPIEDDQPAPPSAPPSAGTRPTPPEEDR